MRQTSFSDFPGLDSESYLYMNEFQKEIEMRELTDDELELVNGGVGPVGAALGGIAGGLTAVANGGNVGQIAASAAFGAASGFFGGIAATSTGITRMMFGAYSIEMGVLGSAPTS